MIKDTNTRLSITLPGEQAKELEQRAKASKFKNKSDIISLALYLLFEIEKDNIDINYTADGKAKSLVIGEGEQAFFRNLV